MKRKRIIKFSLEQIQKNKLLWLTYRQKYGAGKIGQKKTEIQTQIV